MTNRRVYTLKERKAAEPIAELYIADRYKQEGPHKGKNRIFHPGVIDMACRIAELEAWNAERIERDFQKNAERSNPNYSKP
jgi:hypothetical protein